MAPNFNLFSRLRNKNNANDIQKNDKPIGIGTNGQIHLLDGLDEKDKKVVMKSAFNKNDLRIETDAMNELKSFREEIKKDLQPTSHNKLLLLGSSHIAKLCRVNGENNIHIRYIDGATINTLYKERDNKPTIEDTYAILVQAIAGLKFINSKMEHGDINTRNIMIDTKGKVKIIDFGRATKDIEKKGEDLVCLGFVIDIMRKNQNPIKDNEYVNLSKFLNNFSPRSYENCDNIFEKFKDPQLISEFKTMMKNNPNPYFLRIMNHVLS